MVIYKLIKVPLSYAILTRDRLSYFIEPVLIKIIIKGDETSIQGSVLLSEIYTPINRIEGYPACFELRTINGVHDCAICLENQKLALEWIASVTQNIVNCN